MGSDRPRASTAQGCWFVNGVPRKRHFNYIYAVSMRFFKQKWLKNRINTA
jgi:hypothetical protein